jgi:hypothetical protein
MDSQLTSGADSLDPAWLGRGDGGEDRRHERAQVLHAIGSGANDDYTERQRRDLLLELDTAVHRDQNIIVAPHAAQEFPVLDTGPTAVDHGLDSMEAELRSEVYRQLLSRRTRIGQE